MAVSKKTAEALQSELIAAFEAIVPKLPVRDSRQNRAAFFGEGCEDFKKDDFARVAAKLLNKADRHIRAYRKRLLFELANLHNASKLPSSFMKAMQPFVFDKIPPDGIQRSQWTLQYIWRRDLSADQKQAIVQTLFAAATQYPKYGGLFPSLLSQNLEFNQKNFLGQLVLGILENWPTMAKCANPECPVPYFFAKRVTQKYCERGECTRYALRKKALKHWRKKYGNSSERRETQ